MSSVTATTASESTTQLRAGDPIPNPQPQCPERGWEKWKWRFTRATWWHYSYLTDYILILVLFFLGQVVALQIEPFHRYKPAGDASTSYPEEEEEVPWWAMIIASVGVPVLVFGSYQFWGRSVHDFHHATLGILEGMGFAVFFTQYLKLYTGKYRPNYDNSDASDGRQAFPSGHAAIAMQSAVFLSLWLCGKLGIFKKTGGHVWQQFVVFLPMIGGVMLGFSRTRDYHHDFVDVLGGLVLGSFLAIFNYFLKYPPLWHKHCEIPKRRCLHDHKWAKTFSDARVPSEPLL